MSGTGGDCDGRVVFGQTEDAHGRRGRDRQPRRRAVAPTQHRTIAHQGTGVVLARRDLANQQIGRDALYSFGVG